MPLWLSPSFRPHLCIDLGGFDVGMTKQFADGIDVGAACQLQGSERMPEAVEGDVLVMPACLIHLSNGLEIHEGSGSPANTNNSSSFLSPQS